MSKLPLQDINLNTQIPKFTNTKKWAFDYDNELSSTEKSIVTDPDKTPFETDCRNFSFSDSRH